MAPLRRPKYLTCFYCGRKSGLRHDGTTRHFLCSHCDATNYLDENGEITDPPVATDEEAAATRYAAPQPPVPVDNVFCQTCLKNQHLFTKSLAQYFPDDPTDPEYERLELHYFRYRKGLEKRYPQVCDDCAARVEQRIQQAGYTAKTDHLRRMMDLSRRNHSRARRKTALDRISSLGKAVWIAGFFLQMLWHLVIILRATPGPDADPLRRLSRRSLAALLDGLRKMASVLPRDEKLIRWSLEAAVLSAWWNPHFVQFKRGFARHLVGLGQWYAFQALTIFSRFLFASILVGNGRSVQAQLSAQLAMAVSTVLIYAHARNSIRVDTTPLFSPQIQPGPSKMGHVYDEEKREDFKTFAELFNEALDSVVPTGKTEPPPQPPPGLPQALGTATRLPRRGPGLGPGAGNSDLPSTITAPNNRQQGEQSSDEMDWSPIAPQHQAAAGQFAPCMRSESRGLSAAKDVGGGGENPFWYRVPPAPMGPARRLRNPPRGPDMKDNLTAGSAMEKLKFSGGGASRRLQRDSRGLHEGDVEFKQPSFFAPQKDDTSGLADLLSQSFTLDPDDDEEEKGKTSGEAAENRRRGQRRGGGKKRQAVGGSDQTRLWRGLSFEHALLSVLLVAWLGTISRRMSHAAEVQTLIMAAASSVILRRAGKAGGGRGGGDLMLVVIELAAASWTGFKVWRGEHGGANWLGGGVLATMLAHATLCPGRR